VLVQKRNRKFPLVAKYARESLGSRLITAYADVLAPEAFGTYSRSV
jgi:hypothetical protein